MRVLICGGGQVGALTARRLVREGNEVTIVDPDSERCEELETTLDAHVVEGSASRVLTLQKAGIRDAEMVIAVTDHDEVNLLSSLLAKSTGAKKVISLIHRFEYLHLVPRVGLDAAVSPRMSTVNAILRYVRRGRVMTVATLKGIDAEAIESKITDRTRAILPVHLYGQPCDMGAITEIAAKYDLILIEDACQAHGATYQGRPVGSFGTGCFSWYRWC